MRVSTADFDGDGRLDLIGFVAAGEASGYVVWEPLVCVQNSSEYISTAQAIEPYAGADPFYVTGVPTFVDWDGDGDIDFLWIAPEDEKLYLKERLSDSSWVKTRLDLPSCRDFTAADFDGDGDVDVMITATNDEHCRYFERRLDGSLDEVVGADNPFQTVCRGTGTSTLFSTMNMRTTLGDWDGDGQVDVVRVDPEEVTVWVNRPMDNFMEQASPFPEDDQDSEVSLVDVDGDGDLDMVLIRQILFFSEFKYFEHTDEGLLLEFEGTNPFAAVPTMTFSSKQNLFVSRTTVADVDGDGDLDVVYKNLEYVQQQADGEFVMLKGPENPFASIDPSTNACWTLVDWDDDGDLDVVQAYRPPAIEELNDLFTSSSNLSMDSSYDDYQAQLETMLVRIRLYVQANGSFLEVTGAANPFHGMKEVPEFHACPSVADIDQDGDKDLVLVGSTSGLVSYFEQQDGKFALSATDPFSDVRTPYRDEKRSPRIWLEDWDGDGFPDLTVRSRSKMQYYRRGACIPAPEHSFCMFGSCNQRTSQCKCFPGSSGQECSLCDMHHFRGRDMCQKCPGEGSLAGVCSRRGVCNDDAEARESMAAKNLSGYKLLSARGQHGVKQVPSVINQSHVPYAMESHSTCWQ